MSECNESKYIDGLPLNEAVFQYADSALIEKYQAVFQAQNNRKTKEAKSFLDGVGQIASELQGIQNKNIQGKNILSDLKNDILNKIQKRDLIAHGFKQPRALADSAIEIPSDLFLSGQIDWENSSLISQNLEFLGIRLLRNENQKPQEKEEIVQKQKISDYSPDLMVGEKEAAEFLGVSARTLQGWRYKGGGPEFHKIGNKTVKYKISDLTQWRDKNKKRNTSE